MVYICIGWSDKCLLKNGSTNEVYQEAILARMSLGQLFVECIILYLAPVIVFLS